MGTTPVRKGRSGAIARTLQRLSGELRGTRPLAEGVGGHPTPAEVEALRQRLNRLETMVEGLQDALYRQAVAHDQQLEEIARRIEPEAMARALSDDARRRGL
jgi:hypothetical protein